MKNIIVITLIDFHGLASEGPYTFMFEFVVVCIIYDYTSNEHKIKVFPSTLKDATLCSFMSLEGGNITTWAQMKQDINKKYKD